MPKSIAVIGSGFAAMTAVRRIRELDKEIRLDLISPKKEFIYLPSLIWIPSGIRKPDDLRINLARYFDRMQVVHHEANVTDLFGVAGSDLRRRLEDVRQGG